MRHRLLKNLFPWFLALPAGTFFAVRGILLLQLVNVLCGAVSFHALATTRLPDSKKVMASVSEPDADYMGLVLMASAGYDLQEAVTIFPMNYAREGQDRIRGSSLASRTLLYIQSKSVSLSFATLAAYC